MYFVSSFSVVLKSSVNGICWWSSERLRATLILSWVRSWKISYFFCWFSFYNNVCYFLWSFLWYSCYFSSRECMESPWVAINERSSCTGNFWTTISSKRIFPLFYQYLISTCLPMAFQVEVNFPESIAYKLNLYRGYIAICHPDEQHLNMVCVTIAFNILFFYTLPAVCSTHDMKRKLWAWRKRNEWRLGLDSVSPRSY